MVCVCVCVCVCEGGGCEEIIWCEGVRGEGELCCNTHSGSMYRSPS